MIFRSRKKFERERRASAIAVERPGMDWSFTPADAQALQAQIQGEVVLPSNDQYHLARQAFVVNFQSFPQIIVYCEVFSDVAASLLFARTHNLTPACRAGGHSSAGFSGNDSMVLDVSRLNQMVVDTEEMRAHIGPGANFGHINAVLDTYQVHMPGGGCDEVTIGGYLQCGGYGFSSLMYGMNCDCLVEATVMLYDSTIVIANKKTNKDLFWALRGGTGNNFGVLLQATYKLFNLYDCWGFGIRWDLENIGEAMYVLQKDFSGESTPENLGYQCTMSYVDEKPVLIFRAIHKGTRATCEQLMRPLLEVPGAVLDISPNEGSYSALNDSLNSYPEVPDIAIHTRTIADSRLIDRQLSVEEWQKFGDLAARSPNTSNFFGLEPYGGRITSVAPEKTAFVHRKASFDIYTWVFWSNEEEEQASREYWQEFLEFMEQHSSGHAYQGYPNRNSENYRELYWGGNFNTLLAVKQKYDPTNMFCFEQSISPIPEDAPSHICRPKGDILVNVQGQIERAAFGQS